MRLSTPRPSALARLLRPQWVDITPDILGGMECTDQETIRRWALVLTARHIPNRMQQRTGCAGGDWSIIVQTWFSEQAAGEIRLYIEENRGRTLPPPPELPVRSGYLPVVYGMFMLACAHLLTLRYIPALKMYRSDWLELGNAHNWRMLTGEWYRALTALTLHADSAHLVGNMVFGGIFVALVCRRFGAGTGWFLTLLAGVGGNIINAWFILPIHQSIGFSSASFGAAGILAGSLPVMRMDNPSAPGNMGRTVGNVFLPFGAGLGLLAALGTGGGNTDLGAHLWGFGFGLGIGVAAGFLIRQYGYPYGKLDRVLLVGSAASCLGAWALAFSLQP